MLAAYKNTIAQGQSITSPPCQNRSPASPSAFPHVKGLVTFCSLPIRTCDILIPSLTDLIERLPTGIDNPNNGSWLKFTATNFPTKVDSWFPFSGQQQ